SPSWSDRSMVTSVSKPLATSWRRYPETVLWATGPCRASALRCEIRSKICFSLSGRPVSQSTDKHSSSPAFTSPLGAAFCGFTDFSRSPLTGGGPAQYLINLSVAQKLRGGLAQKLLFPTSPQLMVPE